MTDHLSKETTCVSGLKYKVVSHEDAVDIISNEQIMMHKIQWNLFEIPPR